jgi:pimeloyl-ACP methyl ester carboxylesterase
VKAASPVEQHGAVASRDGTRIACTRRGTGEPLVLVDGALCYRRSGPNEALARLLARDFSVATYDRRGRGESSDTPPYAVEREVEDIDALVREMGGSALLYGISSGASLTLEAVRQGVPASRLALYEAPMVVDSSRKPLPADYVGRMQDLVSCDRRADAVRLLMGPGVGLPDPMVRMMWLMPGWSKLKSLAHTLPYDTAIVADDQYGRPLDATRWRNLNLPVLVVAGTKSPAWMQNGMRALAGAIPNARHHALAGQTHIVKPEVLAPVLSAFFRES